MHYSSSQVKTAIIIDISSARLLSLNSVTYIIWSDSLLGIFSKFIFVACICRDSVGYIC